MKKYQAFQVFKLNDSITYNAPCMIQPVKEQPFDDFNGEIIETVAYDALFYAKLYIRKHEQRAMFTLIVLDEGFLVEKMEYDAILINASADFTTADDIETYIKNFMENMKSQKEAA